MHQQTELIYTQIMIIRSSYTFTFFTSIITAHNYMDWRICSPYDLHTIHCFTSGLQCECCEYLIKLLLLFRGFFRLETRSGVAVFDFLTPTFLCVMRSPLIVVHFSHRIQHYNRLVMVGKGMIGLCNHYIVYVWRIIFQHYHRFFVVEKGCVGSDMRIT